MIRSSEVGRGAILVLATLVMVCTVYLFTTSQRRVAAQISALQKQIEEIGRLVPTVLNPDEPCDPLDF